MSLNLDFNQSGLLNSTQQINLNESDTDYTINSNFNDDLTVFAVLWPLIATIGILANLCVIIVLSSKLKSPTQYFIINLAISDMLFLMICPTMLLVNLYQLISYDNLPNLLSNIICKADYYLTHLTVFITCLTLMSMTFDRYMVIRHPLKSLSYRSKTKAILINLAIWIISILLSIPHGLFRVIKKDENSQTIYCANSEYLESVTIDLGFILLTLSQLNLIYTILIAYIIPFVAIVTCYLIMINHLTKEKPELNASRLRRTENKKRRRVLTMIALFTILFGVSWLPIHSFHFALKFFNNFPYDNNKLFAFKNIAHTLTYLNSMLNPFFYTIMGNNFRMHLIAEKKKYSSRLKFYYPSSSKDSISKNSISFKRYTLKMNNSGSNKYKIGKNRFSFSKSTTKSYI